jgi:hypothetical protein
MWIAGRQDNRALVKSDTSRAMPCPAAQLFDAIWSTMSDVLGPTATAVLLQRSARRAASEQPELEQLVISREAFAYTYTLPASWTEDRPQPGDAFLHLARELAVLLSELTGPVVLRRLREVELLRRCRVFDEPDAA